MSSRHGRSAAMHDPAAVDFYGVMGLPPLCEDVNAIRKAYTTLSKERHPDKPGGSKEQFQQLKDAYDCLVDADKKALYDSMFARRLRTEAEQKEKASREKQTAGSSRGAGASSSSTTQHPAQHGGSNYQFGKTAAEKRAQFRRERRAQRAEAGDDDKDEEKFSRGFRSRAEFRAFYETSRNAGNVPPPMAGSAYEKFYDRQEKKWRRDFEKREAASQGSYRRGRPGDYFYGFNAATMGGKFKVGEKKFTAKKTSKEAKREKRRQQKIKQGRNLFQASAADEEVVDLDQQEEFDVLLEKLQEVEKIKRSEQEILAQREKEEKALKVMSGLSANMEKMMAMGAKAGGMMFPNMMPMMPNGMAQAKQVLVQVSMDKDEVKDHLQVEKVKANLLTVGTRTSGKGDDYSKGGKTMGKDNKGSKNKAGGGKTSNGEAKRSRREMLDPSAFWERNARAAAANEPRKHFTGRLASQGGCSAPRRYQRRKIPGAFHLVLVVF
eukprot:g6766.t1